MSGNINQERAKAAYEFAKEATKIKCSDEYKSYVKKIQELIYKNGLIPTIAYIKMKSEKDKDKQNYKTKPEYAYKILYDQLTRYLKSKNYKIGNDLFEFVKRCNSEVNRKIVVEVLSLFDWLRRFSEGLIKNDGGNSNEA